MAFFVRVFSWFVKDSSQKNEPKSKQNKADKFDRDYVNNFAEKLAGAKYLGSNLDQKAWLEELQHQLKQLKKELQKEGANFEKNLREIAQELFVTACASNLDIEEITNFFDVCEFNVADLNKFNRKGKFNALSAALLGNRGKKFLQWLIMLGANVNFRSPNGDNSAHIAVKIGVKKWMMEFLITEGVQLNVLNNEGLSALDIAILKIDRDLTSVLRENGAKSSSQNLFGKINDNQTSPQNSQTKEEQLHDAILSGDITSVNSLVLDGANVNANLGGETILQTAAKTGNWAITAIVADRASVITKENVRGVSEVMGQMIDNAGSLQSHVNNPFHHSNNSQGGGMGR